MNTEDYVSFETAKLLKEKGFDCACKVWYSEYTSQFGGEKYTSIEFDNHNRFEENYKFICSAPTLQMAMKWLRENCGLHCDIGYDDLDWFWNIISVSDDVPVEDRPKMIQLGTACHKTYEDACADAIKYCLENLI